MDFDIGLDILNTELDSKTGSITLQIGNALVNPPQAVTNQVEMWQFTGFASRPAKADPGKDAAQGIFLNLVDQNICIATRDVRDNKIYGSLKFGETTIYAPGPTNAGTARTLYKDDGSLCSITHLIQEGNTSSGNPMLLQLSSDGKINIVNSTYGGITMDTSGISIVSNGKLNIGAAGEMAIIGTSLALNSGAVSLGANASNGVVLGPGFTAWSTLVVTAITQIAALLNAPGPVTGAPGAVTPLTPPTPAAISTSVKAAL